MKTLYLVRHGKSSWEDLSLQDYERPLQGKGIRRTRKVAGYLFDQKVQPDLIVSSHALRAVETAKIIANILDYNPGQIVLDESIYFAGVEALEQLVLGLNDSLKKVLLVGHNPDITNFANLFLHEKIDYMPTTGVVGVEFETESWSKALFAKREILFVVNPKKL
jgi:phosphohistidine phosphatase